MASRADGGAAARREWHARLEPSEADPDADEQQRAPHEDGENDGDARISARRDIPANILRAVFRVHRDAYEEDGLRNEPVQQAGEEEERNGVGVWERQKISRSLLPDGR